MDKKEKIIALAIIIGAIIIAISIFGGFENLADQIRTKSF